MYLASVRALVLAIFAAFALGSWTTAVQANTANCPVMTLNQTANGFGTTLFTEVASFDFLAETCTLYSFDQVQSDLNVYSFLPDYGLLFYGTQAGNNGMYLELKATEDINNVLTSRRIIDAPTYPGLDFNAANTGQGAVDTGRADYQLCTVTTGSCSTTFDWVLASGDTANISFDVPGSGASPFTITNVQFDFTPAAVPLPAGLVLLLGAIGTLAGLRRRT